jgi:hypothetical protein
MLGHFGKLLACSGNYTQGKTLAQGGARACKHCRLQAASIDRRLHSVGFANISVLLMAQRAKLKAML